MSRPWHIWSVFAVCLAVGLAALIWLSVLLLRLDGETALARQRTDLEANTRLALWRMDSALAPLIARESARPYFVYTSFYPAERAYTRMFNELEYGEVLIPSPLITPVSPYIRLHFQVDGRGVYASPQVPTGNMRDLAEERYVDGAAITAAAEQLALLSTRLDRAALAALLPLETAEPATPVVMALPPSSPMPQQRGQQAAPLQQAEQTQTLLNAQEQRARSRAVQQSASFADNIGNEVNWFADVREGPLKPLWVNDTLLLARRVAVNGTDYIQGCWLDWPEIQSWLRGEVADLFPEARLAPLGPDAADGGGRALAALPVRFEPGTPAFAVSPIASPVRLFLLLAWVCVALAALAVVVLLVGLVSLSERRAAFVSAVTHELRTPLTTFRLYTDLLADGMIPEAEKRQRYLRTLHAEAGRLAHLVDNVLAFARIERGRAGARAEAVELAALMERVGPRLADRAGQAGLELTVAPLADALAGVRVHVIAAQVEQILFNLVDNACKYAVDGQPPRIDLAAELRDTQVAIRVQDHGPGIAQAESRRLFTPFHKSAQEAAHSAPGVGLGLALSRRLARGMGGDLRLADGTASGACFELLLRVAE